MMVHPERLKVLPAYLKWKAETAQRCFKNALADEEVRAATERLKRMSEPPPVWAKFYG